MHLPFFTLLALGSFQDCDLFYSHRGPDLFKSVTCYQSLLEGEMDAEKIREIYERSFIALSAVVSAYPKTPDERTAIDQGLALSTELFSKFPNLADSFYWRAVFNSFDSIERDRGTVLPLKIFGSIKSLQEDLQTAINLNPMIHSYGPHRVLGIMHTNMPGIVGGDKTLAENLLQVAFQNAPNISANQVAYAKILVVNGKDDQAAQILNAFLAAPLAQFDPVMGDPLRVLTPETGADRLVAKQLLESIQE